METYQAEGIILNTVDFGDANRVVTIFTKEFGKLEVNAYGCRRVKSPLSGATQIFNHILAELSRGAKVETIRDAEILHFYKNLTTDLERLSYAALFFEIVNRLTLPKMPELEIFNLLLKSLSAFELRNPRIAALIGACQFLKICGVQLNFTHCVICGEKIEGDAGISVSDGGAICMNCIDAAGDISAYPENLRLTFEKMLQFDWKDESKITFKTRQILSAEKFFLNYVRSIIGRELNSAKFIRQLQGAEIF